MNRYKTYNEFVFASLNGQYGDDETYEHETQVYNTQFADYDGYWRSNLRVKYYDTPFSDDIDNFTIGSARAADLQKGTLYFTRMKLKILTAKAVAHQMAAWFAVMGLRNVPMALRGIVR